MSEAIGWTATAVFAASYFFERAAALRRVQAAAAFLWIAYGLKLGAAPVVVSNLIVCAAALYSARKWVGGQAQSACPTQLERKADA